MGETLPSEGGNLFFQIQMKTEIRSSENKALFFFFFFFAVFCVNLAARRGIHMT